MVCGCSSTNSDPVNVPRTPETKESVTPRVSRVRDSSNILEAKIRDQDKIIAAQRTEIERAIAAAEKIRQQLAESYPVDEVEVANLVDSLNQVKQRNMFLETQNKELTAETDNLQKEIDELLKAAVAKDEEIKGWIAWSDNAKDQIHQLAEDRDKAIKDRDKWAKKAASARVYRNIVWTIVGVYLSLIVAKNLLAIYMPQAGVTRVLSRI